MNLIQTWINLASNYSTDQQLIASLWEEILSFYSEKTRHYHDLSHIENMLFLAFEHQEHFNDLDTLLFSIFYHDIVYNAKYKDNEEQSASLAIERLTLLGFPIEKIQKCNEQILATKTHLSSSDDPDTDYLLDIDLSILGASWENYQKYFQGVRKEYKMYPVLLYRPGRKKVLKHFLEMDHIYKTDVFRNKFESKAKENLKRELEKLS